jgi:hypothetical protein
MSDENQKEFSNEINYISSINHNVIENKIEPILSLSKEETKRSRIQKCLQEMINNSTIHALPNINKTNRIIFKIMWFLFFLISFGFNLKLIIDSINNYLLYETITEISIYSEQPGNENNY